MSLILSEDCNFRCGYCPQRRGKRRLDAAAAVRAVELFRPLLSPETVVCFYGGEPLLAFPVLRRIVERMEADVRPGADKPRYVLATNGSLLAPDILGFMERHRFSLLLSFDGLAQDVQRRPGSYAPTVALIRDILARPALRLEVNSVFTSRAVGLLRRSVEEMLSLGVGTIHLSFPSIPSWDRHSLGALESELASLRPALLSFFEARGDSPIAGFRGRAARGLFSCFAGRDRLAVAPDGTVWGCYQIFDYSKRTGDREAARFAFGGADSLAANPGKLERLLVDAARGPDQRDLSTSRSHCLFCPDLEECAICPWSAALESGVFGLVTEDACRIARLLRNERRKMEKTCETLSRPSRRDAAGRPRPRPARDPRLSRAREISGRRPGRL